VKIGRGLLSPPEMGLNLYLMGARVSDLTMQEDLCYEFFVEAFTVYEETISESKAQFHAIAQIISTLYKTTVFGFENYETLITKCAVHCSRLLKRADQCRSILIVSHLFWVDDQVERPQDKPAYRNSKRVLECLQKALKIADSVMDHAISVGLFVEILEKYLWYYNKQNDEVLFFNQITCSYINSLIELIKNNLMNPARQSSFPKSLGGPMGVLPPRALPNNSKKLLKQSCLHFTNILRYIQVMQEESIPSVPDDTMPNFDHGFQSKGGRWIEIDVPSFQIPIDE
jgi:vacuolar protein sorting-associated protein 35